MMLTVKYLLFWIFLLNENTVLLCCQLFFERNLQLVAMAILFAVVARGTTILAKHAWCGGNFLEVTEQILAKIPSENNKLTYSHGRYDWSRNIYVMLKNS